MKGMSDSVFTKIIKGELPSHKVYEDDMTIAFMDIYPMVEGQVVVVPKTQIPFVDDLPEAEYNALFNTVKMISKRIKEVLGSKRVVILVFGIDTPDHAHVVLFPADTAGDFHAAFERAKEGTSNDPDHDALAKVAARLKT